MRYCWLCFFFFFFSLYLFACLESEFLKEYHCLGDCIWFFCSFPHISTCLTLDLNRLTYIWNISSSHQSFFIDYILAEEMERTIFCLILHVTLDKKVIPSRAVWALIIIGFTRYRVTCSGGQFLAFIYYLQVFFLLITMIHEFWCHRMRKIGEYESYLLSCIVQISIWQPVENSCKHLWHILKNTMNAYQEQLKM